MAKLSTATGGKRSLNFEDAISITGYGFFNVGVLLSAGLCLMMVIIETMGMMFVIPAAQCDLELSLSDKSLLSAISFLGVVSSSHLWGFLADTRGRKNVLLISMVLSFLSTFIASFIPQDWLFIVFRFINGVFVSGSSAVVYAFVGEFHDSVYRPKVVSWLATFVAFGNMMIPGLAWAILPLDFSIYIPFLDINYRSWRMLVLAYGSQSILAAIGIYLLPESPKFLIGQGMHDEALAVLKKMYRINTGGKEEDFPVDEILWTEASTGTDKAKDGLLKSMWKQTVPLFRTPYAVKTFMVCLLQFGTFASTSGLFMWYPDVLNRMTLYMKDFPGQDVSMCKALEHYNNELLIIPYNVTEKVITACTDDVNEEVFHISLGLGGAFAVLYIFIGIVINIVGNKNLLISFLLITSACGLASQYVEGVMLVQGLMGIFLLAGTCIGILNAVIVDLFPTQLRAMALAISLMAGRLGAMTGSNVTGPLLVGFCNYAFYVFASDHLLLIFIIFMLPSGKKAKSQTPEITA